MDRTWSCAIDFDGTSTKWLISPNWDPDPAQTKTGRETGATHDHIWQSPKHVAQRLIAFLASKGAKRVTRLGISVSGCVEPATMCVLRSDRMSECFRIGGEHFPKPSFDLCRQVRSRLLRTDVVGLCNDGVAASLGGAIAVRNQQKRIPGPLFVVTLGSWPIATIVDPKPKGIVQVFLTHFQDKSRIGTSIGLKTITQALNNKNLNAAGQNEHRRSRRIGRSIVALLATYYGRFKWQPSRVVLLGANSCGIVKTEFVQGFQEELKQRPRNGALTDTERSDAINADKHRTTHSGGNISEMLLVPTTYEQQSQFILKGAVLYAQLRHNKKIKVVSI